MIAIIDYGMGNLRSVEKGFEKAGYKALVTSDATLIKDSKGVVLPGVGAFGRAIDNLRGAGLVEVVIGEIKKGKPYLGLCLGLQLLFTVSYEGGHHKGFDLIPGEVTSLPSTVKVPHIGWNKIEFRRQVPIFKEIPDGSYFYFVHSYYASPHQEETTAAITNYGVDFVSSVWEDNIFAVQFHPEKSSALGLQILKNFGEICQ